VSTDGWKRIEDGYASSRCAIYDNGAGVGPTKGGGRWALEIDGQWVANIDTLREAKLEAVRRTVGSHSCSQAAQ
jgi:hypothetical protein